MTVYTKSTNFATKDTLTSGDPLKIVKGTEINTEFDNIATAVNSKSDTASPTFTGTVTIPILSYAGTTLSAAVTGTGKMVLDTSPTLVTPALGTPASGVLTNCTGVQYTGFKNRIINGAMVIDQRNAGASIATPNGYTLDRFRVNQTTTGKLTAQQNAGSVTPAVGFSNYLGVTSSSAYAVAAGDAYWIDQAIEGFNFSDMAWGTANAKTITLSFQVYSSLTGTFAGALRNSATSRSYPFTYSIPVANTWTAVSVTIAGDTSGTWIGATNGVGVYVGFSLGCGTTYTGTASAWAGSNYLSATGSVSVVGTNGATFYITGVQLEKGSTATSFDYRPYGTELALCQRYCAVWTAVGSNIPIGSGAGQAIGSGQALTYLTYPVTPRVPATGISTSGTFSVYTAAAGGSVLTSLAYNNSSNTSIQLNATLTTANLVQGYSTSLIGTSAQITATGMEL